MANGYEVRIGEPTKSANGKRLMPFVMIFREEQAQESIHDLKPCMSDSSISRQAVIDAIDEIEAEVADGDGFQYEKWRQFFCDLPSADIDLSDYSDRLWRKAYEQGKADAEPRWIPVTERLPEDGERVLLQIAEVCLYGDSYVEDYYYVSGSRSKGRWFINVHPDVSVERGGIIAYMPLPEPWKGGDDD